MSDIYIHRQPWPLVLAITLTLIVSLVLYLRGWLRLRGASCTAVSLFRLAAFIFGIVTVWITTASALASLDHASLTFHMLKHLLLMTVAAPLLVAGSSTFVLACGLPNGFIHDDTRIAGHSRNGFGFRDSDLVLCWLAGTATVIGWHLPAAFQLGMRSRWAHSIEDASFLVAGLLFWWPIARPWSRSASGPEWDMVFYLFLATLPCDILSAFLVFCNRVVYSHYLFAARSIGMSPLHDQERAGALMWVWVTFVYLLPAMVITLRMLSPCAGTAEVVYEKSQSPDTVLKLKA